MINLKYRSHEKELLDADNIPFDDIRICMKELNSINTLLGGHAITRKGTNTFIPKNTRQLKICEIGSGGGDNMHAIYKKYKKRNIELSFTGIDLKKACSRFAAERYPELRATWLTNDYKKTDFSEGKPDIIFSSLFCHHFSDEEIISMLLWMDKNSNKGFFINDLQRNPIAYYLIKWLTAVFSGSYLVKNDACISVARSFHKKEWQKLFEAAGLRDYSIRWKWAFRYLVICKK